MITIIRALAAVLAAVIAWSAHTGATKGTVTGPVAVAAYTVAASILVLCWGIGRLETRYQEKPR